MNAIARAQVSMYWKVDVDLHRTDTNCCWKQNGLKYPYLRCLLCWWAPFLHDFSHEQMFVWIYSWISPMYLSQRGKRFFKHLMSDHSWGCRCPLHISTTLYWNSARFYFISISPHVRKMKQTICWASNQRSCVRNLFSFFVSVSLCLTVEVKQVCAPSPVHRVRGKRARRLALIPANVQVQGFCCPLDLLAYDQSMACLLVISFHHVCWGKCRRVARDLWSDRSVEVFFASSDLCT